MPDPSSALKAPQSRPTDNTDTLSLTRLDRGGSPLATNEPLQPGVEQYELADYKHIQKRQELDAEGARRAAKKARKARRLDEQDEMKFSHSIQFNAVPDWSSQYIAYSNLKKLSVYAPYSTSRQATVHPPVAGCSLLTASRIYQLEKNIYRPSTSGQDAESSPLIGDNVDPDQVFTRALDIELEKISTFYQLKELEIYGEVGEFLKDEAAYKAECHDAQEGLENSRPASTGRRRQGSLLRSFISNKQRESTISQSIEGAEDSDDDDDETTALNATNRPKSRSKSTAFDGGSQAHVEDIRSSTEFSKSMRRNSQAYDDYAEQAFETIYSSGITLKKRAISLYVQLCELKSFVQLNKTGFSKVLKKYDKILDRNLKLKYVENFVLPAYPFRAETIKHIEENIAKMEKAYADIVTQGDVALAKKELRLHLREHVVWERNTVWREMIGIERKAQAANMGIRRTLLGIDTDPTKARKQGDDDQLDDMKELRTPVGRFFCPTWLFSSTMYTLIGIVAIFIILLFVPIMDKVEQQNCLAMLVFVSLLWATEV